MSLDVIGISRNGNLMGKCRLKIKSMTSVFHGMEHFVSTAHIDIGKHKHDLNARLKLNNEWKLV